MKRLILILILFIPLSPFPLSAADYRIDRENTVIGFSVSHMVIATVEGKFGEFAGSFRFDEKSRKVEEAHLTVKVKSLDTNHDHRDYELKGIKFFNAEKFPELSFKLKDSRSLGGDKMAVTGDLTIKETTRPIELTGEFLGSLKESSGRERVGFIASGTVNRSDFGLVWNKLLETGELVVGEKVSIHLEIQGILQ